jgi:hypothetical protein
MNDETGETGVARDEDDRRVSKFRYFFNISQSSENMMRDKIKDER